MTRHVAHNTPGDTATRLYRVLARLQHFSVCKRGISQTCAQTYAKPCVERTALLPYYRKAPDVDPQNPKLQPHTTTTVHNSVHTRQPECVFTIQRLL